AELGKARIGPNRDRRIVHRLPQIGDAPVTNIRFSDIGRRQAILPRNGVAGHKQRRSLGSGANQRLCCRMGHGTAYIAPTPRRTLQLRPDAVKLPAPAGSSDRAAGWIARMVSMTADLGGAAGAQPSTAAAPGEPPAQGHWSLLTRLENTAIGVRQ